MNKLSFLAAWAAVWVATPANAQIRLEPQHQPGQHWAAWTPAPPAGSGSYLAVTYMYDDGSAENALGATCNTPTCTPADAMLVWAQYFDTQDPGFANATADTITRVEVAFGTPVGPGPSAPAPGTAFEVYVYDDPGDDSNPLDLTAANLVAQASSTSVSPDSDTFESVTLPPTWVAGGFWVVCAMPHNMKTTPKSGVGEFPAAMDQDAQSLGRSWIAAATPASAWSAAAPQSNLSTPWIELDQAGYPAVWLLRAEGSGTGPVVFCTSKNGLACGTPGMSVQGVASATQSSGFTIRAAPARSCKSGVLLYNQASAATGMPFDGGVLCVAASGLKRAAPVDSGGTPGNNCDGSFSIDLNAFAAAAWAATGCAPPPGQTNPVTFLSTPGQVVYCQMWGRDSVATGTFLSDGIQFVQGP